VKLFVLDNYDSFTFNLVQAFGELGAEPVVARNDRVGVEDVFADRPDAIVISPGPGTPATAGIAVPLIRAAADRGVPVLGVCLGHQAIGEAFGGQVVRAARQMHGKSTLVIHNGDALFRDLASPFEVMRYHSLIVAPDDLPDCLVPTAWSADQPRGAEIMALRHRASPTWGVQFHPESIGTPEGKRLLHNFLALAIATA
jgi:anthranilate synthase/aminodeoxychorismate synthase-like glutamine amidotransferase